MARPKKDPAAVKDLHRALTRLARRHPATAKDIELWIYSHHGARVSPESIRKALTEGVDPTACSVELLLGLRSFYGCDYGDLGPLAEKRMREARSLTDSPGKGRGQRTSASGWLDPTHYAHAS